MVCFGCGVAPTWPGRCASTASERTERHYIQALASVVTTDHPSIVLEMLWSDEPWRRLRISVLIGDEFGHPLRDDRALSVGVNLAEPELSVAIAGDRSGPDTSIGTKQSPVDSSWAGAYAPLRGPKARSIRSASSRADCGELRAAHRRDDLCWSSGDTRRVGVHRQSRTSPGGWAVVPRGRPAHPEPAAFERADGPSTSFCGRTPGRRDVAGRSDSRSTPFEARRCQPWLTPADGLRIDHQSHECQQPALPSGRGVRTLMGTHTTRAAGLLVVERSAQEVAALGGGSLAA
jgi:hypothetical protein